MFPLPVMPPRKSCASSRHHERQSALSEKSWFPQISAPELNLRDRWVPQLGERLSKHARVIALDRYESLNEHQQLWSIGVLQACEEFASNLDRSGQTSENSRQAANLRSSADKAAVEMLNGVGIHSELIVAVAQKEPA